MTDKLPEIKEKNTPNPIISHIAKIAKNNFYDYSDINDANEIILGKYKIDRYLNIYEIIELNLIPDCKILSLNNKDKMNHLVAQYHEHIIYWDYADDYCEKIEETTHFSTLNIRSQRGSIAWHLHSAVMEGKVEKKSESSTKIRIFVSV